jgi:hypothetical protein
MHLAAMNHRECDEGVAATRFMERDGVRASVQHSTTRWESGGERAAVQTLRAI